jgi:hypothetical protein
MGIPYSHQINSAFEQVTPLVAQGFQVLETTKNIAVLIAWIAVFSFVLLSFIFSALIALLVTVNPDLTYERQKYVTPALKTLLHEGAFIASAVGGVILFSAMIGGLYFAIYGTEVETELPEGATQETKEGEKSS